MEVILPPETPMRFGPFQSEASRAYGLEWKRLGRTERNAVTLEKLVADHPGVRPSRKHVPVRKVVCKKPYGLDTTVERHVSPHLSRQRGQLPTGGHEKASGSNGSSPQHNSGSPDPERIRPSLPAQEFIDGAAIQRSLSRKRYNLPNFRIRSDLCPGLPGAREIIQKE
jgi:hypothetical protein